MAAKQGRPPRPVAESFRLASAAMRSAKLVSHGAAPGAAKMMQSSEGCETLVLIHPRDVRRATTSLRTPSCCTSPTSPTNPRAPVGLTPTGLDIGSLAKGYLCPAVRAETASKVKDALATAFDSNRPMLIEVPVQASTAILV